MKLLSLALLLSTLGTCGRSVADAPLAVGDVWEGELTADDFDETYGLITDALPLEYPGGDAVAVVVTSEAMDPFAIVALRGAPVGADAGQAGGAGACVVLEAPHPISAQVYVSSAGGAPHGGYRVEVRAATPDVVAEHGCQPGAPPGSPNGAPPEGGTLTEASHPDATPATRRALTDS